MKNTCSIVLMMMLFCKLASGQLWEEKTYSYDSLLHVPYGTAINFNGEEETLHMDIYFPTCDNPSLESRKPILMWIHGGAFIAGDKNDQSIQLHCKEFAKRGYITASIDYRLGFISDEVHWQCNYPNYSCVFATDSSEWVRAYYRSVQDGKGALRYLINRHEEYKIDTNNVFVAGESAGAFIALGIGLMDTIPERSPHTYQISKTPPPNPNTLNCIYNQGIQFSGDSIARPDLGDINGTIEPTQINYTIKGIGNMYGAMLDDLLKDTPIDKHKPAIYSFHQPCDIVVPIDSNFVYWGINWCLTNGYGCQAIANNKIMLYGSRTFSNWNTDNGYGFTIQDEFTNIDFPFNFLFGEGSCLDQVNKPCHAYDNRILREDNLASFFAGVNSASPICDATQSILPDASNEHHLSIYPNPTENQIYLEGPFLNDEVAFTIYNMTGQKLFRSHAHNQYKYMMDLSQFNSGVYILQVENKHAIIQSRKIVKN